MTTPLDLAAAVIQETKERILQKFFDALYAVGLDVESWHSGDPTRSELVAVSQQVETYETLTVEAIKGGFLDTAERDWLSILAASHFAVARVAATYAECTLRLTNTGAAVYTFDPDDLTVASSTTGKTYRNSTGGTLSGGGTLDVTIVAEEAGSGSSAAIGEIDTVVSPALAKVTVTNATAAVGIDAESDPALRARCRGKLSALSPNGAAGAYDYVATTPELNGGANVTKSRTVADSNTGAVTVYLAGPSGAVSAGDVTLVQSAFETYCEPLCITSTATNSSNLTQAVTYTLWVYDSINLTATEVRALVEDALLDAFAERPIGGDVITPPTGYLYKGFIEATILRAVAPHGFRVSVTTPAADVSMTAAQVAVLGTVTGTVNLIAEP